jgi:phage-related protein
VLLVGILLLLQNVDAQQDSAMQKFSISFTEYLLKEQLYNDAGLYLQLHPSSSTAYYYAVEKLKFQSQKFNDEKINYEKGLSEAPYQNQYLLYAKLNQLHQAFEYMPENISAFFNENKKQESIWNIASINHSADSLKWKKVFAIQQLTKNLMIHDTASFKNGYENFKTNYPHQFNYSLETMMNNYNDLQNIKNKNVLKAGLLSAVIPGAGKMYYGNWGQGFAALFTTALIAAEAYSGFKKKGVKSIHGWAYTGLFSVFYVGNIWGTVIGLKVKQRKAYENINHNLLDNADKLTEQF